MAKEPDNGGPQDSCIISIPAVTLPHAPPALLLALVLKVTTQSFLAFAVARLISVTHHMPVQMPGL